MPTNKNPVIAPSLLGADFSNLKSALNFCNNSKAEWLHLDIMDQQFVPNLSFGPSVVKDLRAHSDRFFDVHLMVSNPFEMLNSFIEAGANGISFHIEATESRFTFPPKILINMIKKNNLKCGLALKPKTPFSIIKKYLEFIDYIVVMSVEPGFGGQSFIPSTFDKISEIDNYLISKNLRDNVLIQVDGGIKLENYKDVVKAGADILVAGSQVFQSDDPIKTINHMYSK
ncbi:MAG: ribulose-phosphate 3-epimerase [Rickettsiales bacterium TMED289]|nr:MAG: ribulose-phosphate 3-epimerase [Rickettsiales bacterium TMED289]|tara:strand:+ start:2822 stop:3505 length:684 start_codon:yes stop_codon:yes gene_type:complete